MNTKPAQPERLARYWVNQPSSLQPDHSMHGACVLAGESDDLSPGIRLAYFAFGPVISARLHVASLSPGWPTHLAPVKPSTIGA